MATQLQIRRGTSAQVAAFTGAEGEIVVNTTNDSVHVNDGSTAGGFELARADLNNVSDTDLNAALTGNTLASLTITSADINGGTIDNTVIGGSTAAAGSFTTGTFSGNVGIGTSATTGFSSHTNIFLGGTGNIYADSAASADSSLSISQNAFVDSDGSWEYIVTDEATNYYQNAGNHVWRYAASGTAGTDISWSEAMRISGGNVGIGTSSLASGDKLTVAGRTKINSLYLGEVSSNYDLIQSTSSAGLRLLSTGGSVYLDSSGNVGINDSSPSHLFTVKSDHATNPAIKIEQTGNTDGWGLAANNNEGRLEFSRIGGGVAGTHFTITNTGSVGIGESSVESKLHVKNSLASTGVGSSSNPIVIIQNERANTGTSSAVLRFDTNEISGTSQYARAAIGAEYDGSSNVNGRLLFSTADTSGNLQEAMRIDSIGNITQTFSDGSNVTAGNMPSVTGYTLTNTTNSNGSGAKLEFSLNNGSAKAAIAAEQSAATSSSLNFYTENSGTFAEAMRIDSSGRVLIGQTSAVGIGGTPADINGTEIGPGYINLNRDDTASNKVLQFGGNGVLNGFIATLTSAGIVIAAPSNNGAGLAFNDNANIVYPTQTQSGVAAVTDNAIDLGTGGVRFQDVFATNGTIQTSDRNEKQDIEALSDAEQRVAVAAKGLLRKFRWKSAVEEKGDDARINFGIIAQDLQDAFTAEGLDAGRYAMFISSTWTDEETGEERTRLGVRYSELLAFIISAI